MDTGYLSDPSSNVSLCHRHLSSPFQNVLSRSINNASHGTQNYQSIEATSSVSPSTNRPSSLSSSDIQESDIVSHVTHHATGENSPTDEDQPEIIMTILWYGGRLGAAYYDSDSAIVHILLDTLETDSFTLPRRLVDELHPSTIVTSAKQDERFINLLKKLTGTADDEVEGVLNSSVASPQTERLQRVLNSSDSSSENVIQASLEILPGLAFSYEEGKHRIISTNLPGIPEHYTDTERTLHMTSKIPFDCISAIRATGGLIRYLEKNRIGVGLEKDDVKTPILDFKTFTMKDVLFIDRSTYSALQIFKKDDHPAVFKMGSGSKEGLSLFGIMDRTRSRPGRKLLQLWFNRPLNDKTALNRRLDAVEYFAEPRNLEIMTRLQEALKHTRKLGRILKKMKTATSSVADWLGLYRTVISVVSVADICRNAPRLPDHRPLPRIFSEISQCSTQELINIVKIIQTIMDKEESVSQNRFIVQAGIDSELDEKKHLYNGLPSYLHHVALAELETFKDYISGCQIMYMRRVGYLLVLKNHQKLNPDAEIPGLEFKLTSGDTCYYKTDKTRELDADPGDILEEIGDQETTIMHQMQNTILERTHILLDICQYVAELDCLISFAIVAKELNYVRPNLTTDNYIDVKGGRHPLQECAVSLFVPNDIMMGNHDGRIKVITGPNACGKSIYLKQTGLIVFMAHIGSFIPAESGTIGLISKIYTRIRTQESLSTGLSTFAVDLNQISMSISGSNCNTLVLVDEFGKGTATVDGVALLASCLTHWIEQEEECPFVICSTHFHSIVKRNLLPQSPLLRYNTLETLRDQESDDLVFLYQLTEGVAGCSYAAHIALVGGLPKEVVVRGKEMTKLIRENTPIRRYDSTSTKSYMNRCTSLMENFLSLDFIDDNAVKMFMKNTVPRAMETPKENKYRGNLTTDSNVSISNRKTASSFFTSVSENSDANVVDAVTSSDNEDPLATMPKRPCHGVA
ncbi:mutS protein homolog 5-like [Styela clava]